jgi:hypothetical protein
MWLAVASQDAAAGIAVVEEQWAEGVSPEALAAASSVVDLDAEQTACPACMEPMPGGSSRCPGCGLRFG